MNTLSTAVPGDERNLMTEHGPALPTVTVRFEGTKANGTTREKARELEEETFRTSQADDAQGILRQSLIERKKSLASKNSPISAPEALALRELVAYYLREKMPFVLRAGIAENLIKKATVTEERVGQEIDSDKLNFKDGKNDLVVDSWCQKLMAYSHEIKMLAEMDNTFANLLRDYVDEFVKAYLDSQFYQAWHSSGSVKCPDWKFADNPTQKIFT